MKMIICGHGRYASGIKSALNLICGLNERISVIDFVDSDDGTKLYEDLKRSVGDDQVLIVTDIVGGTPFKKSAMLAMDNENIDVLAGANLAMILEMSFKIAHSPTFSELLEGVLEGASEQIVLLSKCYT
ncbi:hypothetical protein [Erysipelothrix aquatica]|uniref:PTS sugar transporter subunit IIA domain-containing protein n=1 Tax=Erysipelothrix aquatica TaxID=2683714 RepID=UPI001356EA1F|nr:hypothetical protein [Erysipelothrix aquatica]